jgi:hypothetical protein
MTSIRFLFVFLILFSLAACNGTPPAPSTNTTTQQTASPTPITSPTAPLVGFEKDLQYVRNGGYKYIWVFARKDGKLLDRDDGIFLRTNAPQVVDWVGTEEGRKIIAGTNFNLEEGNLAALKKRFAAEDYSNR